MQPMAAKHLAPNGCFQVFFAACSITKDRISPAGTDQEIVNTFANAFAEIKARPDFAEISAKRLGKYPMYTGADAKAALGNAITVNAEAKGFVVDC